MDTGNRFRGVTGPSAAKPFPEARPPHLPDVLTRQSPWAVVFAVMTVVEIVLAWRSWSGQFAIPQPDQIVFLADLLIPTAVVPLLGFVLFVRRPDAWRTMPLLVFGILLISAVTLISEFDPQVYGALRGDSAESFDSPVLTAYITLKTVVRLLGVVCIGAGISATRSEAPTAMQRPLSVGLGALAVVAGIGNPFFIDLVAALSSGQLVPAVLTIVLTLFGGLAWAYLAATTVGGWLARESPRPAWALGAIGISYLFAYRLFGDVSLWFGEAVFGFSQVLTYVSFAAWLLLLVAFAIGLPTPASVGAEATRPVDVEP